MVGRRADGNFMDEALNPRQYLNPKQMLDSLDSRLRGNDIVLLHVALQRFLKDGIRGCVL